jgi:hypothetical protein
MCDAKASYSHAKSQKSPKEAGAHRVGTDDEEHYQKKGVLAPFFGFYHAAFGFIALGL